MQSRQGGGVRRRSRSASALTALSQPAGNTSQPVITLSTATTATAIVAATGTTSASDSDASFAISSSAPPSTTTTTDNNTSAADQGGDTLSAIWQDLLPPIVNGSWGSPTI